jgi:hypothetical protein
MEVIVKSSPKIEIELATKVVKVGDGGTSATPDWNASKRESGFIKSRTHYVSGTRSIPFENWNKSIDENGDAIYSFFVGYDEYSGCIIGDANYYAVGEENYIFFETEWVSLSPAILADIRLNLDIESGDTLLEIKLYKDGDSEDYLKTFINNTLFATGQSDFIARIAENFIPNTIARTNDVDELREETTALWENLDHGTFPDLVAGDLAGRGESVPAEFGFRASGGKSIKDGRAYIKRIKGNSVVWNQWAKSFEEAYGKPYYDDGITYNGNKVTIDNWHAYQPFRFDIKCSTAKDHLYLVLLNYANTNPDQRIYIEVGGENAIGQKVGNIAYFHRNIIYNNEYKDALSLYLADTMEGTITLSDLQVIDLTKMFGAGYEPNTIEDFNARVATLGVDLNAYNEGQVIHMNTESIKSVGDNAWDEEWITGRLNTETGQTNLGNKGITSKNYIRVLPNETYYCGYNAAPIFAMFYDAEYNLIRQVSGSNNFINIRNRQFTTPANAVYMRFYVADDNITTYNHDILISLYHSGWKAQKDDQYQPYWQDTLPLPIIRKYFPDGMKKAGTAHDEIRFNKATKKWEYSKGKIKSVDMGDMAWSYDSANQVFTSYTIMDLMTHPAEVSERNKGLLCSKYSPSSTYIASTMDDKSWLRIPKSVTIKDTSYTDAASFKAAMAGVILYYEAAEWEWVELDEADQNFRDYYNVADFGTEMSQSSVPSAPFSADIIYQFNAVDMIREHEIEITELQSIIATMQAQLTSLINGGQ